MEPKTEVQLSELIRDANTPLRIIGGGTRGMAGKGEILSIRAMSGITLYDPGALTLVARAGTPLAEIDAVLKAENQRLPFELMDHRALLGTDGVPTIGGVVAANISGPRRIQAGACRDSLIGVRFVDGMGTIIKNGGRVMKNVTGYDLVKLMAGSHGTLGVLTEVSFKVLPDVETSASLVIGGLDHAGAVKAMSRALGSPYEITGAAFVDGETVIRIEGFESSVSYRADKLRALLAEFGDVTIEKDHSAEQSRWQGIRDVERFAGQGGNVWRISVKPSDAPELIGRLKLRDVMMDWGGGLIWALADPETDIRAHMGATKGHATLVRGQGFVRFHPESAGIAMLTKGIKAKFDPRGILNAGMMGQ